MKNIKKLSDSDYRYLVFFLVTWLVMLTSSCGGGDKPEIADVGPDSTIKINSTQNQDDNFIKIAWNDVETATHYRVAWSTDSMFSAESQVIKNITEPEFIIENNFSDVVFVKVTAIKRIEQGVSEEIILSSDFSKFIFLPIAPSNLKILSSEGKNSLTWDAFVSETNFDVYRAKYDEEFNNASLLGNSMIREFEDVTIKPGERVAYWIVAKNSAGESMPSDKALVQSRYFGVEAFRPLNDTGMRDFISDANDGLLDGAPTFYSEEPESFPGQDGSFGRDTVASDPDLGGIAGFNFTKLDVNGNALSGDYSDGEVWTCVRDNVTGLVWEHKNRVRNSIRYSETVFEWYDPNPESNGGDEGAQRRCEPHNTYDHVQNANQQAWCGLTNWRLPTTNEIRSIIDYSIPRKTQTNGLVSMKYFPNIEYFDYWSSQSNLTRPERAFAFHFYNGNMQDHNKKCGLTNYIFSVILVSGDTIIPSL